MGGSSSTTSSSAVRAATNGAEKDWVRAVKPNKSEHGALKKKKVPTDDDNATKEKASDEDKPTENEKVENEEDHHCLW
jgi:hypothetical protein